MKNSHPPQSGERSGDIRSIYRDRGFQPASSKRIRRLFPQASRGTDWLHGSTNCSSRQAGRPKVQAQSSMSTGAKGEFLGRGRSRAQPTPIVQLSPEKDTGGVFRTDCSLSLFIKSSFSVHGFAGACFFAQGDLSHSEIPLPNPHTWSVLRSASGFYPPFFWGKGGGGWVLSYGVLCPFYYGVSSFYWRVAENMIILRDQWFQFVTRVRFGCE